MGTFDRKKLLSNIAYLLREKKVKISDLESAANVSAGYFSRLNKADSTTVPGIEILASVSDALKISLDSLIHVDYEALTPSERYLIDFIDKLISKTSTFDFSWKEESVQKMIQDGLDEEGEAVHPLFKSVQDLNGEWCPVYNSLFHSEETIGLRGPAYYIEFQHNSILWITNAAAEDNRLKPHDEIELYIQDNHVVKPICHTIHDAPSAFNEILFTLYRAAAESSRRPKVDPAVKKLIDSFMTEEDIPF